MPKVVVDASLALRWVLEDEKEARVDASLHQWIVSFTEMLVPPLFLAEVTNSLYLSIKRKRLDPEEARTALSILQQGVQVTEPPDLYLRSLELALEYKTTNAYDAQYLALAEIEGCELWTADKGLSTIVKSAPWWLSSRPYTISWEKL